MPDLSIDSVDAPREDEPELLLEEAPLGVLRLETTSPTALRDLSVCPRRFCYSHLQKERRGNLGPHVHLGRLVHVALDRATRSSLGRLFGRGERLDPEVLAGRISEADLAGCDAAVLAGARARLRALAPTLDLSAAVAAELRFMIAVEGVRIRGIIDRLDVLEDGARVRVTDYKTGFPTDREQYEHDPQTYLYGLAARDLYPFAAKIEVVYVFVLEDKSFKYTFPFSAGEEAAARDLVRFASAAHAKHQAAGRWPATVTGACSGCDHRGRCDAYQNAMRTGRVPELVASTATDEELLAARFAASTLEKLGEARRKELDELIRVRIQGARGKVEAGGLRASFRGREVRDFSFEVVGLLAAATGESWDKVARSVGAVSATAVDRFLEAHPGENARALEAAVDEAAEKNASTWVDVREIKAPKKAKEAAS
jgi:RecB family exonuclease